MPDNAFQIGHGDKVDAVADHVLNPLHAGLIGYRGEALKGVAGLVVEVHLDEALAGLLVEHLADDRLTPLVDKRLREMGNGGTFAPDIQSRTHRKGSFLQGVCQETFITRSASPFASSMP